MKLLFWLFVGLVATVLALFTVSNRAAVSLGLWPLPFVLELPLYLAIVAALLIGFVDTFGKVLWQEGAGIAIYLLMAVILLVRPAGLLGERAMR